MAWLVSWPTHSGPACETAPGKHTQCSSHEPYRVLRDFLGSAS